MFKNYAQKLFVIESITSFCIRPSHCMQLLPFMNINGCWKKVDVKIDHEITISFHTGPHCSYVGKGDVQHMAQHVAKWSEFSIHTFITWNIVVALKLRWKSLSKILRYLMIFQILIRYWKLDNILCHSWNVK